MKFPPRAGISLLEVLISILVLTVGLVGMAVLLTTGHRELVEAAKYDHAAGLGRACFRDLEVRGYLRPTWWLQWDSSTTKYVPLDTTTQLPELCVVDPLACSYAVATGLQAPASLPLPKDAPGGAVLIPRYSMRAWSGAGMAMPYNQAERLCRSADDMVFNRPDDPQARPAMSYNANTSNQPMNAQFNGDYSFFYMISPSPSEVAAGQVGYVHDSMVHPSMHARQFTVSCVVCYKRELGLTLNPPKDPPTERMLSVMGPSGIGGGELRLLKGNNSGTWLDVRPGQWLMLVGEVKEVIDAGPPENAIYHPVASWFRITSVGDPMTDKGKKVELTDSSVHNRTVTIHGGDWTPGQVSKVGAVLMDGVVGVFQKTITLDGSSRWSQ